MLKDFINLYAAKNGTPGTVLHIGAGLGDELPVFEQLSFKHIKLVEANPELAEKLTAETSDIANVEVHQILVAGDDEIKIFYRTSNPLFDSLKKPTALCEFYPNLEILDEYTVSAQSLNSLLRQFPLDPSQNNLLVLETRGAEFDILQKTDQESLQQFAWIVIKTSSQALYEQSAPSADLKSVLESMAFELTATRELNFPFQVQVFRRNDAKIEMSALNSEIEELKNDAKIEVSALNSEIEELKNDAKTEVSALNSDIEELKKALSDALKSLNMNSKLLAKAQTDNEALRQQYSEKVDSEQALIKLIKKLRNRLQAAADFYGQLEKDHPEIIHLQKRITSDGSRE